MSQQGSWPEMPAACRRLWPAPSSVPVLLICTERTVFKGTQMGIQVGSRSLGKLLENEIWPTDSALLFNQNARAGLENNDYKLVVAWPYSASCFHFQMFGLWEGPKPHCATQLLCLFRGFQETVSRCGLDSLLFKIIINTILDTMDSKEREERNL